MEPGQAPASDPVTNAAQTLEQRFANLEASVAVATKAVATLRTALGTLGKAAALGDLRAIRTRLQRIHETLAEAQGCVDRLEPSLQIPEASEPDLLRTQLPDELLACAAEKNITITVRDRDLLAFPLVLRVEPDQRRVLINAKRVTSLRPSILVAEIDRVRARSKNFNAERFAALLHSAHVRCTDHSSARLDDIWDTLTLLPASRADYPRDAFYADIHRLDRSGVRTTATGINFELRRGSTGMRSGGAVVYAEDGEPCEYYRIVFEQNRSE